MAETIPAETRQGSAGAALSVVRAARTRYAAMPAQRRRWLGFGLLMIVALIAGVSWYVSRPDWRVLYSGLEAKDVQVVSQELSAAGITYRMTTDQAGIEVVAESLDKARMTVAAKGMPQTGRLGFELFDKPNWVGSEFDEHVNYQRALEGELEHTIETLGDVRSARVHLVLPQQSLFADEARAAKASVVMKLKHPAMSAEQADSIRNLVAGAVEDLTPAQVTLVDADGRANLETHGSAASQQLLDEQAMEARLVAMLEPLAGQGNVRATVNVTYSTATEEHMDEVYDPAHSAQLTVLKKEQSSASGGARPSGVPGTASNTPAAAPVGAVQGSAQAAAPDLPPLLAGDSAQPVFPRSAGQGQSVKEENGTYAVTKHTTRSEEGPGRVQRVSAAVVVNDRMASEGTGSAAHTVWHPRTADELHRLEELAQAAVGFDARRGDQVVLQNVSFSSNISEKEPAGLARVAEEARTMLTIQPGLLKAVMLSMLGVLVVWFVLRPVAGQVVATLREPLLLTASTSPDLPQVAVTQRAQLTRSALEQDAPDEVAATAPAAVSPRRLQTRTSAGSAVVEQIADHLEREPARGTRLLEAWIAAGTPGVTR